MSSSRHSSLSHDLPMILRIFSRVAYGSAISGAMAESFMVPTPCRSRRFSSGHVFQEGFIPIAEASPDARLLQGFAEKDNCTFGQGIWARSERAEKAGARKGGWGHFELPSHTAGSCSSGSLLHQEQKLGTAPALWRIRALALRNHTCASRENRRFLFLSNALGAQTPQRGFVKKDY
jgi:hypothetical protein